MRHKTGPDKVFSETSLCGSRFDSSALGPDILEDEPGDDKAEENSDDAATDVIQIGVGRVPLKNAVEESECNLQPGITDPFASGGDPAPEWQRRSRNRDCPLPHSFGCRAHDL